MARSSYIYVVALDEDVMGTFTVKHEMVSALRRVDTSWPSLVDAYRVTRYPDGTMAGIGGGTDIGTGREVLDGDRNG